jgi:hypothetical protein
MLEWLFGGDTRSPYSADIERERERLRGVYAALDGPHGDNASLYETTAKLVEAAHFPDYDTFAKRTLARFVKRCDELQVPLPHFNIAAQMAGCAAGLYSLEALDRLPPNPADYGTRGYTAALGALRDILLQLQRKAVNPQATLDALTAAVAASMLAITQRLPALAQGDPDGDVTEDTTMIRLIDILPNVGGVIEQALEPFNSMQARDLGLFRRFKQQLQQNVEQLAERSRAKRALSPAEYEGSPIETVSTYLSETPLERIFAESRVPFALPDEARYAGHWIIAPPGRGKTTLLHSMVMDDLGKDATVILMDSKGDLINPIRDLKELEDRLIIVDPDPDYPIAINPLDIPKADVSLAVSNLEYVFSSLLESKMTPLQTVLFRSVLRALIIAFPSPTLETFRDILTNGIDAYQDQIAKLPHDLQEFFAKEFTTKVYEDRRKEIIWRLRLLLENDAMRGMLLALRTRFNIAEAMDAGKVIIINNSKARLGEQGAEFFGRFFIAQVLAAAQQRTSQKQQDKKPVYFYIDECQNVIARDERIPTILDECRSQKVALILAHQRTEQITSPNVLSALANCAIRYANSDDEARVLAPKLRTDPEFLYSLKRGHFAAFIRDMTSHAIAFQVSKTDFTEYETLSPADRAALKARMQKDYGVPAHQIEPSARNPATMAHQPVSAPATHQPLKPNPTSPVATSTAIQNLEPKTDAHDPHTGDHTEPAKRWG